MGPAGRERERGEWAAGLVSPAGPAAGWVGPVGLFHIFLLCFSFIFLFFSVLNFLV